MTHQLLRLPAVIERYGKKRAQIYNDISAGLIPKPVKLGRISVWGAHEIDRIVRARIAGRSDDEVRELVKTLVAARKHAED